MGVGAVGPSGASGAAARVGRAVGSGEVGPIARLVRDRYFDAVRGRIPEYDHWLTPIE